MFVLAKIKRKRKNNGFSKLVSNKVFFNFDQSSVAVLDYDPETLKENGEFYRIINFKSYAFCPAWVGSDLDSKNFNDIESKDFNGIDYIFQVDDHGNLSFQVATSNVYLREKKFYELGENVKVEADGVSDLESEEIDENKESKRTILVINDYPDAYYDFDSDTLIFKSLNLLNKIFSGANDLYKEATNEEVIGFLSSNFMTLTNGFDNTKVGVPNRKKIAICLDTFFKMSISEQLNILDEARDYIPHLYDGSSKKFIINSDENLKFLLYGIQERYFTTKVSKEKRIANSIVRVD